MRGTSIKHCNARTRRRGFTLIEAMLLVVVLSIVALATGTILIAAIKAPAINNTNLSIDTALKSKMEYLEAQPFANLTVGTPSSLSDSVTINGTVYPRTVDVSLADPNGGSSPQPNFKLIQVQIGGQSLYTLVTQP